MDTHDAFLVLHALRLKGIAPAEALGVVSGVGEPTLVTILHELRDRELAKLREGRLPGWAITPAGRAEHAHRLAAEVEASGHRGRIEEGYQVFLPLNAELLAVCTAWQVKDLEANLLNDHFDQDYDDAVIDRLHGVHSDVTPICQHLSGLFRHYHSYEPRLDTALANVKSGLGEWFARPIIDSYHTVWMELHEDLLATLRIDRASESAH